MLHRWPRAVRDRRAAERRFSGARRADHRQLRIGGRRDGPADTARLHPDDAQVRRSHLAGPRIRRHQRAGRHRCSGRPVDRRCHHNLDQLARGVRISGRGRRAIVLLSRRIIDPIPPDPTRPFDAFGAILSAVGMFFVVFGILQADNDGALMAALLAIGAVFLVWFFLHIRGRERTGKDPPLSMGLFRNRTSNLGLVTQNIQWLLLMGTSFTVAVFLQTVRGYNAIETGVIFTAATLGVLVSSLGAGDSQAAIAEDLDHRRLRGHRGRDCTLAGACWIVVARRSLRTGTAPDRPRPRRDADSVRQCRAVKLPRAIAR